MLDEQRLEQVRELVTAGYGGQKVATELSISRSTAHKYITRVREELPNLPPAGNGFQNNAASSSRLEDVQELMNRGLGVRRIAKELGITESSANYWITKVNSGSTRMNRVDRVRDMLDEDPDTSTYDIAKRYKTSPVGANNTIRMAEGTYSPADDWVKRCARSGVRLSFLKEKLGIKSLEKAKQVIKDNFENCYISAVRVGDDTLLTPIPNSAGDFEDININVGKKKDLFTYYVSPNKNYMHVKFNDELPGGEIKIYNWSDIHYGSKACRTELANKYLEMIEKEPMSFIQAGGDLVENNSKASVGSEFDQYLTPSEQIAFTIKSMAPIAYKLIDSVSGNHEDRAERFASLDCAEVMAQTLKVPYFRNGLIIQYEWRGITKTQWHCHRYANATEKVAIERQVKAMISKQGYKVDWFSSGHTHDSWVFPYEIDTLIPGRGRESDPWFIVNAGSFTSDTGTYSERFGRSPKDLTYIAFNDNGEHWAGSMPIRSL